MKNEKSETDAISTFVGCLSPDVLLDGFDEPVLLLDRDLNVRFLNKACHEVLGGVSGDLVGMSFFHLLPPGEEREHGARLRACLDNTGSKYAFAGVFENKGGLAVEYAVEAVSQKQPPLGAYLLLRMKQTEDGLIELGEKFRNSFEHAAIGMCLTRPDGVLLNVNRKMCELFCCAREDLEGRHFKSITFPDDMELTCENIRRMLSGEAKSVSYDKRFIRKNGEVFWSLVVSTALTDSDGKPIHLVTHIQDITAHKQATDALENNTVRLRKLHEFDRTIIQGYAPFEKIGETALAYIFELIGPEKAAFGILGAQDDVLDAMIADQGGPAYRRFKTPLAAEEIDALREFQPGTVKELEEIAEPALQRLVRRVFMLGGKSSGLVRALYSADGPVGLLYVEHGAASDFSENDLEMLQEIGIQSSLAVGQKLLQQQNELYATGLEEMILERTSQLEAAVKELEAFTYTVSHDPRAPLRSMSGFVRILLEDYGSKLDDEGRRVCGVIAGSAQQMGRLIDDLLALSRVGRSAMVVMPVNMEVMVQSLYNELTTEEQRARIDFSIGPLPEAPADPTLIRLAWMNLIDNAVKFSSKKPDARIRVEGKDTGGEIVYSVADNGAGFDMSYQDKLFGVFQRLHSVKEFDGTGVGLAIVQRIIQRHGGRIWASAEENNGATFYFTIRKEAETNGTGSD